MAFRPFFLAAGLWAVFSILLWSWLWEAGEALPSLLDPLSWHIHAMIFGFSYAAIAGFLLTAIANWTRRPAISGFELASLLLAWLIGRVATTASAMMPFWLAILLEMLFPALLLALALREVLAAGNKRNYKVAAPITIMGLADLLMLLEAADVGVPAGLGWRLGLTAVIALISLIGGRIIPAFTRNWLQQRGFTRVPPAHNAVDTVATVLLWASLIGWAILPYTSFIGWVLILAGVANLIRLSRWRGLITAAEPLLFILHIGFFWIGAGFIMLGVTMISTSVPLAAAIHALTVGVVGTMILAIMPRVTLGHTGRILEAGNFAIMAFFCIIAATILRILAAYWPGSSIQYLHLSALFWVAGFGLFLWRYTPMLFRPRVDGR